LATLSTALPLRRSTAPRLLGSSPIVTITLALNHAPIGQLCGSVAPGIRRGPRGPSLRSTLRTRVARVGELLGGTNGANRPLAGLCPCWHRAKSRVESDSYMVIVHQPMRRATPGLHAKPHRRANGPVPSFVEASTANIAIYRKNRRDQELSSRPGVDYPISDSHPVLNRRRPRGNHSAPPVGKSATSADTETKAAPRPANQPMIESVVPILGRQGNGLTIRARRRHRRRYRPPSTISSTARQRIAAGTGTRRCRFSLSRVGLRGRRGASGR
jgi:hypothetical protein